LVLKRVATRYLPAEWMARPKRGFGLPPHVWNKEHILPMVRPLVLSPDSRLAAWIDRDRLAAFISHQDKEFASYACWGMFILETWLRTHPATPAKTYTPESMPMIANSTRGSATAALVAAR
jgi:asparagine synthase (glutamine-hydrolysing)